MTTATTTDQTKKFCQVYADAVIQDMTNAQWEVAAKSRELSWKGEPVSLPGAAALYENILGYNNFRGGMLTRLSEYVSLTFPRNGSEIEVTPARESSVAVYLKLPVGAIRREVRKWIEANWEADEVDWVAGDTLHVWWD